MLKKGLKFSFPLSLLAASFPLLAEQHAVWYLPNADESVRQGFIRVVNNSEQAGAVSITGFDESGTQGGVVTFTIAANETKSFNSGDLQNGNVNKGLSNSFGNGEGAWRLNVDSQLNLDVLAYMRTSDGFLTSVHDTVEQQNGVYHVPTFNPGSNTNQVSVVRISNASKSASTLQLTGTDDKGNVKGPITFNVDAGETLALTALDIEDGNSQKGLNSGIGVGNGKWKLDITSTGPVTILSLLQDPNGYLTNLSTESPASKPFLITSSNFENGQTIPRKHACPENGGSNISPALSWQGAPIATTSFALIMEDEISPCGTGNDSCRHWTVVNIPVATKHLPEGSIGSSGALENSFGYFGMCPPNNHVYNFTLYALKEDMPALNTANTGAFGMRRAEFESAYGQYILKKTTISGSFQ